mgnify:CR=1 FL=1
MSQKKMKTAIVGYGGMGGWHADHLLKSDVAELAGIYDIKEERGKLAESRGIRSYASYEELLADRSVELVTVLQTRTCLGPDARGRARLERKTSVKYKSKAQRRTWQGWDWQGVS